MGQTASAGGREANVIADVAADRSSGGQYPTPAEFCPTDRSGSHNLWLKRFALDGGRVDPSVCNYTNRFTARADAARAAACREGLNDYYELMDQKLDIDRKIADLDAEIRSNQKRLEQIQDQIAEGTYCPYCNQMNRGQATGSLTSSIIPMVGMLAMVGFAMGQKRNQPPMMRPGMPAIYRPGGPPQMPPFPGPGAYPGNPYPARMPGYMGIGPNNTYGSVPGGIGPGAFGCQGTSPLAMGNQFAPQPTPFMNGAANPFMNPYTSPMMNPGMQSSMLNPGFGPGFMPMLGNGVNGYNPFDPFTSPYMAGAAPNSARSGHSSLNGRTNGRTIWLQ
ncbi:MAG: hypothetical protein HC902_01195 [Calothrix sp. SM1_5_4]|nr:hypothetical protein [Calothrix sp. SM1_5_4]